VAVGAGWAAFDAVFRQELALCESADDCTVDDDSKLPSYSPNPTESHPKTRNARSAFADRAFVKRRDGGLIQWGVRGWTFQKKWPLHRHSKTCRYVSIMAAMLGLSIEF
jgi:hypothetical protein